MCRTGGRLVTVLVVLLMACTGCATPISRVLDSAAGARFETVPDLARALRERLLADRTIRFTYDVVSYPTDGEFDTSNYSGDGEYTVDPAGTNSRHRNPQQRNRRAIELVAVGSTVWIFGTDDGTARGPWRSQPPNRIVGRFLELRHSIWLTQLDAISEAFALRGVSEAQRGGRSVVEYRLATTSRNSFSLTALHLGLPPGAGRSGRVFVQRHRGRRRPAGRCPVLRRRRQPWPERRVRVFRMGRAGRRDRSATRGSGGLTVRQGARVAPHESSRRAESCGRQSAARHRSPAPSDVMFAQRGRHPQQLASPIEPAPEPIGGQLPAEDRSGAPRPSTDDEAVQCNAAVSRPSPHL